jgi:predicted ATPase/transcriptional regulator with XRE-family HTH domain
MQAEIERGSFGPVLRRLRLEARISQEELAERARLSVQSISSLERGRRRAPYRETIRMLSEGLQLSDAQRRELEAAAQRRPRPSVLGVTTYDSTDPHLSAFQELRGGEQAQQNLPLQRTSLVGRKGDIDGIVHLVQRSRLVTLTGTGGIGKTRAALAVGDALLESTAAGVWLVELAPVMQGSAIAAAVARTLNVQEVANRSLLESLIAHLKHKPLLLILDNCEHVIAGAAAIAEALLQGCPPLRILATSRESLRIAGEQQYRLPSLQVPTVAQSVRLSAAGARDYSALVLFAQRAQQSDLRFTLDDRNAGTVAEICRRLDGIPLAIELAAARVNTLPLQTLSANLDQRLRILTGGNRTALPRQQTMRALIDWSYDLLSPPEQRLFERLSIFAGGCTLTTITAVYADDAVDEIGILELLSSLVNKSLVAADLDVPESRYRLLESSREYAHEKLAARGELTDVTHRHAAAYTDLAERMEREHDLARNSEWFARAELEIENWRAALHWSLVERGDIVLGQRLAGAMRAVWPATAIGERRRWLQLALDLVDAGTPPLVAANLEHSVATVAYMFGEFEAALSSSRRLTAVFAELGDALGVARAQFVTGRSLANMGRVAEGEPFLKSSLAAARELGNTPLAGLALGGLARARSLVGDLASARAFLAEAFTIYEATGADAYSVLAKSAAAGIEFHAGNVEQAVHLSTAALDTMRSFGLTLFVTMEMNNLAAYLIACERWNDARALARDTLELALETQQLVELAWSLQHLAAVVTLSTASLERSSLPAQLAAQLLGYVDARITALGTSRQFIQQQEYDRVLTILRNTLGTAKSRKMMMFGALITEDEAIETAQSL